MNFYHFLKFTVGKPEVITNWLLSKQRTHELTIVFLWLPYLILVFQVSNLFARDELDEITQGLIGPMKKELPRVPPTNDNLYNYFISRSRKNLHVVLCFSPVSVLSLLELQVLNNTSLCFHCRFRVVSLIGTLRFNDATATRTSLRK